MFVKKTLHQAGYKFLHEIKNRFGYMIFTSKNEKKKNLLDTNIDIGTDR